MSKENPWYEFNCRIVWFKITDNTYERIITNLDRNEFLVDEIEDLYKKDRGLKHAIRWNAWHSKKRKFIK